MKLLQNVGVILLALIFSADLFSQEINSKPPHLCGTPPDRDERLIYYQQNLGNYRFLTDDTLFIPLKIHILGKNDGTGYVSRTLVEESFCNLNEVFLHTGIQFFIKGDFNYIDNTDWYSHDSFSAGERMILSNNVPDALNSYFVDNAAGACGYYNTFVDGVVVANFCLDGIDQIWTHEIGHQFTLPHTFYGWEATIYNPDEPTPEQIMLFGQWVEVEKMDGSNCREAADGFCDTAPDYLSYPWICTADNPLGIFLTDPLGNMERVDGSNIMSYAFGPCRNSFSEEQTQAMRMNILLDRPDIVDPSIKFGPVESEVTIIHPAENEIVQYDEAYLKWESVPNATYYQVQLTSLPFFSNLLVDEVVRDTFLQLPQLVLENQHMVRIKPLSEFQPCNNFSNRRAFIASELSNTDLFPGIDFQMKIVNPTSLNRGVEIELKGLEESDLDNVELRLSDINGRMISQLNSQQYSGNKVHFETGGLSAGIYLITLITESGGMISERVILQ